jgi:hypothetical protein
MRISHVTALYLLSILVLISACVPKKSAEPLPDRVFMSLVGIEGTANGLWFTTSNYSNGGKLARLDLQSGLIQRSILTIAPDTVILPDFTPTGERGLILLTRMGQDAVTLLKGTRAEVVAHRALTKLINPQGAARDSSGRIWITTQESNSVLVLSPDLKDQVKEIDLSSLQASTVPFSRADLAQVARFDRNNMVVTAQRLDRSVRTWKPHPQSGIARINTESFQVEHSGLVEVTNPIQMAVQAEKIVVAGAGDLSAKAGGGGKVATLGGSVLAIESAREYGAKIIAADLDTQAAPPAVIAWYQDQKRSCVEIGSVQVVCDGSEQNQGYVFGAIRRSGKFVFVSYIALGAAELWVLEIDSSFKLRNLERKAMNMPIQSLSFGP